MSAPLVLPVRELVHGDVVRFTWMTHEYGRAEFVFCPVWKRGKIVELWITPHQQPDATERFVIRKSWKATSFSARSWETKGIDPPRVWRNWWCKEHKTASCAVYVPDNVHSFCVHALSDIDITFDRDEVPA